MKRAEAGEMALQVSVGLHYGPVVLGDIGVNRLEYTLIGNTVNVASRMESLTRSLSTRLVLSDAAYVQAQSEGAPVEAFDCVDGEQVRGIAEPMRVWRLP
jgi:adenylate cyclase